MRSMRLIAAAGLVAAAGLMVAGGAGQALDSTIDLTDPTVQTADDVAQALVGAGVSISNVSYTGDPRGGGTFGGGALSVGFDTGVTLSSGNIADWVGPTNDSSGTSTNLGAAGDADLSALAGFGTFDASILEFEFTADAETVFFRYVFGSEEYNEFVNTEFNDVFAFYVNGVNCATVPDGAGGTVPVSVNNINNGNPFGDPTATNPALYRDNTVTPNPYPTELDGLTVPLTCMANVNPAPAVNTMKLAIADASDPVLDSAVFIEAGSLTTTPPTEACRKITGGGRLDLDDGFVTLGGVAINDEQGLRGNLQVNDHRDGARFHGSTVDSLSVVDKTATWTGTGSLNGEDGYSFEIIVTDNRNGNAAKKGDPDTVEISISDGDGVVVWSIEQTDLKRGNMTVHDPCEDETSS